MEARKAEFARFFDRLINRASRKDQTSMPPETCKPSAVPVDPAPPTIENLGDTIPSKNVRQQDMKNATSARPWGSTVMGEGSAADGASLGDSTNDFMVGRWYPFTFKMMLHKLYELEEWGKKVKEVLERSRKDFKPLSEVKQEKKITSGGEVPQEQAQLKLKKPEFDVRGTAICGGAISCASSNSSLGNVPSERIHNKSIAKQVILAPPTVDERARIVKKRCVGRDKIFTGNPDMGEYKPQSTWVYKGSAMRQADGLGLGRNASHMKLITFKLKGTGEKNDKQNWNNVSQASLPRKRPYIFG